MIGAGYLIVAALLIRFSIDRLIFNRNTGTPTHETQAIDVRVGLGATVRVHEYRRNDERRCVIFFPGRDGGTATYERTLFPAFLELGAPVYSMSYPGQDGASGRAHIETLRSDVATALDWLRTSGSCHLQDTVFVGRSLGATLAISLAGDFHPRGVLVDGASPDLASAVRASMSRHWLLWPLKILPLEALLPSRFELNPMLSRLGTTPISIFQGANDDVTPYATLRESLKNHAEVRIIIVPGATHSDTYLRARAQYVQQLSALRVGDGGPLQIRH